MKPKSKEDVLNYNRSMLKIPTFKTTDFGQPICRFALPLITGFDDAWHVMGTCVMVTPGLALTAKHVAEECMKSYHGQRVSASEDGNEFNVNFTIRAVQFFSKDEAGLWWVNRIHASAHTDIVFLQMQPLFDKSKITHPNKLSMNLLAPLIGSRIVAFGYPKGRVKAHSKRVEVSLDPVTTVGEVLEVHHDGRDSRLPFPVFRTNARFDNGMSGGPVIDETGRVCGLICSSMPPFSDNEDHVSYAVLLWPCLGTKLTFPRNHAPNEIPYTALELAKDGYIHAAGWEHVNIVDSKRVVWDSQLKKLPSEHNVKCRV